MPVASSALDGCRLVPRGRPWLAGIARFDKKAVEPRRIYAARMEGQLVPREVVNDMGTVAIADDVIATIAGIAATECYGVVGMASRRLRDGLAELLGRENLSKGVEISVRANQVAVNLNLIVGYGIRISEVAHNVSEQVKYRVEGATGLEVVAVNMNVQGVRVADGR
jgi:uncharacterized alkaline shock family protein YloU